jgi:hypothetical protein
MLYSVGNDKIVVKHACICMHEIYHVPSSSIYGLVFNLSECAQGTFGTNCTSTCTCNSTHSTSCHHVTGACTCKAGWEGSTCSSDIDECANSTTCPANSQCVNTQGSFVCQCHNGYFKNASAQCQGMSHPTPTP